MELAAIITTLVVILQIITLAIVFKTLKVVGELAKRKVPLAHNTNNNSYKNRRDRDFKSNKRLPQDNAPKPQIQKPAASTSADPV
ncbi:MAG: hypothetical protein Q4F84_07950, partial [Fibrobacter sp.]|nr:hypothetical protein [Fibrobacter sp.]